MLTHSFKLPITKVVKPRVKANSEEHKKVILQGNLRNCSYADGDMVEVLGRTGDWGYIIDVLDLERFDKVEWVNLMPRFMEVYLVESNDTIMVHPSEIVQHQ